MAKSSDKEKKFKAIKEKKTLTCKYKAISKFFSRSCAGQKRVT